jgi:hypothetical protein
MDGDDAASLQSGQHSGVSVQHFPHVVVADNTEADKIARRGKLSR